MKITDAIKEFTPSYELQDYTVEFLEAVEYADTISQLEDNLSELADQQVDIYNSDLIDWLRKEDDAIWTIEDALSEYGMPEGSDGKPDFYAIIRQGQYKFYSDIFYKMLEEYRELLEEAEREEYTADDAFNDAQNGDR